MIKKQKACSVRSGYIMIMALLLISMITMIVVVVFNKSMIMVPFTRVMIDDQKARILSQAGIEICKAQLCKSFVKKKQSDSSLKNQESQKEQPDPDKQFLEQLLPVLNTWQIIPLKETVDGVEGEIALYISCEDGKININSMFDFEKHEFFGEKQKEGNYKNFMQEICKRIEKQLKIKDLFAALEKFLKKQKVPLEDITQLLEIKECASFKNHIFYEKQEKSKKEQDSKEQEKDKQTFYLADIFTTSTNHATIEPWVFSAGMIHLLGLSKPFDGKDAKKGSLKELLKNFKKRAVWKTDWNSILKPVYQKELQSLPEYIDSLLSSTFSPTTFMVVCQAKVGRALACSCAIVERSVRAKEEKQEYAIQIKKMYWI